MVSIRYLAPGASDLRFQLIRALAVMSTNWIGAGACGMSAADFNGAEKQDRQQRQQKGKLHSARKLYTKQFWAE